MFATTRSGRLKALVGTAAGIVLGLLLASSIREGGFPTFSPALVIAAFGLLTVGLVVARITERAYPEQAANHPVRVPPGARLRAARCAIIFLALALLTHTLGIGDRGASFTGIMTTTLVWGIAFLALFAGDAFLRSRGPFR